MDDIINTNDPCSGIIAATNDFNQQRSQGRQIEVYYVGGAEFPTECSYIEAQLIYPFYPTVPIEIHLSESNATDWKTIANERDLIISPSNLGLPPSLFTKKEYPNYFIYNRR